jgi:hypothetical protein
MTDSSLTEHARLRDHVASMDGGLEAKINEGGECIYFQFIIVTSALSIGFHMPSHLSHHQPGRGFPAGHKNFRCKVAAVRIKISVVTTICVAHKGDRIRESSTRATPRGRPYMCYFGARVGLPISPLRPSPSAVSRCPCMIAYACSILALLGLVPNPRLSLAPFTINGFTCPTPPD